MPIPVRSHSPIKANSAASGIPAASRRTRTDENGAKEPTRLTTEPAAARATTSLSAPKVIELKPYDPGPGPGPGPVAKLGRSAASTRRGASSLHAPSKSLSASNTNAVRTALREATVPASSRSHHATHKSLSGPVRPKAFVEGTSKPTASVPHAMSSTLVKTSSSSSGAPSIPSTKPNFSPYQQHYSPKKPTVVPGAPAVVSHHPSAKIGSASHVISSKETVNLRDELLQLGLVKQNSAATLQAYETSMQARLRTGYEEAETQLSFLRSLQRGRQASINAFATREWLEHEEKIQEASGANPDTLLLLAHCVKELHDVSQENGPLDKALTIFDKWCANMSSRRSKRTGDDRLDQANDYRGPNFVVAPQWSALISSVHSQVKACAASLKGLHSPIAESSSISSLINMHINLAEQILQEIATCGTIEDLIVRGEDEWFERAVEQALQVCDAELHHSADAPRPTRSIGVRRGLWECDLQDTVTA